MPGESNRDLLEAAVEIAEAAGELTLRYFQQRLAVDVKPDGSEVTVADRETETYIRRTIESRFPGDGILGEELGETGAHARRRWIIDPIDGTFSFVRGVPLYGVLIGVEEDAEPIVGVIRLPALGETVAAAAGEGCTWGNQRAHVSDVSRLEDALCLTTEMHFTADAAGTEALGRVASAAGPARTWGDCYGYALVASGRADVMLDPAVSIWDCAALLPIIEEAGGRFTDWRGRRTIRGASAAATNGLLHDQALALLQR